MVYVWSMDCGAECCRREVCRECRVAAKHVLQGVCNYCLEAMAEVAYVAPRGTHGHRVKRRGASPNRAQDEADLAFFYNSLEGVSGLHASPMQPRTSVAVDPHEMLTNTSVLEGLARGRRVEGKLRQLSSQHQRTLERVFSENLQTGRNTPFPSLTVSFGPLAGVVDLLGGGDFGYDDRRAGLRPDDAFILKWEVLAKDAIEAAMIAYARAR